MTTRPFVRALTSGFPSQELLDPVLDLRALDVRERLEIRDARVAHRSEEEPAERDHGVRATVYRARDRLRVPLVLRADEDLEPGQ